MRNPQPLPDELRTLVKTSVATLGRVIEAEIGAKGYARIERIRQAMADTRGQSDQRIGTELQKTYRELARLSEGDRHDFATAYTLMLELMNACENAYRTFRLRRRPSAPGKLQGPEHDVPVTYVLTAHPTESRSSHNIAIFYEIQKLLVDTLEKGGHLDEKALFSLLEIAWQVPIVRSRKPRVEDEAEHIYSVALREENLERLLKLCRTEVPIYLRSWVGGDKDGHPGVDETSLQNSLQASRNLLYAYARRQLEKLLDLLELFPSSSLQRERTRLREKLLAVRDLAPGDGPRMRQLHSAVLQFKARYESAVGPAPEPVLQLVQLLTTFPGLVIPLELREDSSLILEARAKPGKNLAIERMLRRVHALAKGVSPRWYAQGFIISMAQSMEHIDAACDLLVRNLGGLKIRVIPLFEQQGALRDSPQIVTEMLKKPRIRAALKKDWLNRVEVMLGYSDSSKESGVLSSRMEVSRTMRKLDRICQDAGVQPIFFHGSGGSVDRGGGPVEDQLASWSKGALRFYKATIQGEMVERSFASPEIAESQFKKISETAVKLRSRPSPAEPGASLEAFTRAVESQYRGAIGSREFMSMIEEATPYRYLTVLKIGSRPSKRASRKGTLAVSSLRAIPWILCWTQTRVLFPTWWGTGAAWAGLMPAEKEGLRREFETNPAFRSYIHVLGFTLAKVQLPVWNFYLHESRLTPAEKKRFIREFAEQYQASLRFFSQLTGAKDPLYFRPWLSESIRLRSPMIHPLNLLQILAEKDRDLTLLRIAATGIASGMLTTG
jgi:phosphoenolpyruvate carboxylase